MPARSRRDCTRAKPAAASSARTAGAWLWPCSSSSQPPGDGVDDGADGVQPIRAAGQGQARLVRQRGQVGVALGDVGGVADDEVKRGRVSHGAQPVALPQVQAQGQALGVGGGHGQGVSTGVAGPDVGLRALAGQGQGDGAAARAQVQRAQGAGRGLGWQERKRPVHQRFGVVTRVENALVHLQLKPVERFAAREVGHWLARRAALAQAGEAVGLLCGQRVTVVRQQPGALVRGAAQRVQQQHVRFRARQAAGGGLGQGLGQCGGKWSGHGRG